MLEWVELHKGRWRKKTYQTIRSRVERYVDWSKGRGVSNELLKLFFADLAGKRHGRTYNNYHLYFCRIFKDLGEKGMMDGIETVRAVSTPAKYFQRHQIVQIKEELLESDPCLWMACQFIYYCFIRPGELRMLRVGDIHFDEWKICVRSNISKNGKEQYVTIPVPFRPDLEGLKRRSPSEYIFFHRDCTKPLGVNTMLNRFRKVLKKLGFGLEYKLYSWKHTGAIEAHRGGASLKEIQIQLRHHSLDEVDGYMRQLGVYDLGGLEKKFPPI
jgi:integrase